MTNIEKAREEDGLPEPNLSSTAIQPVLPTPERRISPGYYVLAFILAVLGGFLGIGGAFFEEIRTGLGFIAAAPIEEALKPAGIYILLVRWPFVLRSRAYTATLTAVSGLTFGILEACVYLFIYFPHAGHALVLYRLTIPLVLHTTCSFIVGLGLDRGLIDWANGAQRFPRRARNMYLAAMGIHGCFNLTAVVLTLTGVVKLR